MSKEIVIPFNELSNPQTITDVNIKKFKEQGLDIHTHEVDSLEDDHKKKVRRLKIKNTKYFFMGGR